MIPAHDAHDIHKSGQLTCSSALARPQRVASGRREECLCLDGFSYGIMFGDLGSKILRFQRKLLEAARHGAETARGESCMPSQRGRQNDRSYRNNCCARLDPARALMLFGCSALAHKNILSSEKTE